MSRGWTLALKNIFFPIFCKRCGVRLLTEENGFFCPTCWEMSPRVERPFCTICGRPHTRAVGFGTRSNFPCAECRDLKRRPFGRIYGACYYADAVEEAIKLFKFHDKPRLAGPISEIMGAFAELEIACDAYDVLMAVPLHRVRLRDRGYNQSELLAEALLPIFPNAVLDHGLRRIRPTRVQSRLADPKLRRDNVKGAFALEDGAQVNGKTVLLIDDVVTTSGTVSECARVLRRGGAAAVDVFAAALAVPTSILPGPSAKVEAVTWRQERK